MLLMWSLVMPNEFEDANTRRSTHINPIGEFEGIFVDDTYIDLESKTVEITFIFSHSPSAYISHYDSLTNKIVLELYDTKIGNSIIDHASEYPITKTTIQEMEYDLNDGIDGLEPDIRKIVRVELNTICEFPHEVYLDKFSMIVLKFYWHENMINKSHNIEENYNRNLIIFFLMSIIITPIYLKIFN